MLYGEQENLNVASIEWPRVASLSFFLSSFFFFFLFFFFPFLIPMNKRFACSKLVRNDKYRLNLKKSSWGGGCHLSFQDTRLYHSDRRSTAHKSGEFSQKHTHKIRRNFSKVYPKCGKSSENDTHKSGNAKTAHQ